MDLALFPSSVQLVKPIIQDVYIGFTEGQHETYDIVGWTKTEILMLKVAFCSLNSGNTSILDLT